MGERAQNSFLRILFLGVDQPVFRALEERFAQEGGELIRHEESEGVCEAIGKSYPALVLLDLGKEVIQSLSMLAEIRHSNDVHIASVPVIILSEAGDLIEISQALKEGISDYIIKRTFDIDQALAKIHRHARVVTPTASSPGGVNAPEAAVGGGDAPHQLKLLIVEDDKFLRDLAVQKLTQEGFQVLAAIDGEQGAALAASEVPDIVLLDILLPGIDGFEVLRRIRANAALATTRVVMLSNFSQREDITKALSLGAERFFVKANYTLDEIVKEVKNMFTEAPTTVSQP